MIVMAVLTLTDLLKITSIAAVTHIGVVGFVVTMVIAVVVSMASKPKYYGEADWTKEVSGSKRIDVKLDDIDLKVLNLIRYGHGYLSDITDSLKVDGGVSNASIEKLDQGGYIERMGLTKSEFYTFKITEKGENVLPRVPDEEREMVTAGLTPMYVAILKMTAEAPEKIPELVKKYGLNSLEVSSIVTHLVRKDYVLEKGVWKRKLELTEAGKTGSGAIQCKSRYIILLMSYDTNGKAPPITLVLQAIERTVSPRPLNRYFIHYKGIFTRLLSLIFSHLKISVINMHISAEKDADKGSNYFKPYRVQFSVK